METKNIVSAFTEEQASKLSKVSVGRLKYWDRTGFFSPSLSSSSKAPYSRIYSFIDVAALRVLGVLQSQHQVSLHHLRKVRDKLCRMDNSAWSKTTLYVLNRKVYFADPIDGRRRQVVSDQYAIDIPLAPVLTETKLAVRKLSARGSSEFGKIVRHRFVSHNSHVVAGTRIPVRAIQAFFSDGFSFEEIQKEYPTLSIEDISAAIHFKPDNRAA